MKMEIDEMIEILEKVHGSKKSAMTEVSEIREDPFMVLISCILSLRTKDEVTIKASKRLFKLADTMEGISKLSTEEIEDAIYP
ncbi:MAG: endonuclease III, partial [Halobacteriota archaeon]|nr:endonuclease III [Halobacteriota archaeon]